MPIFSESILIVQAVEAHLVDEPNSNTPVIGYLKRLIWLPGKFLKLGIDEKIKGAGVWAALSLCFMLITAWLINGSGVEKTEMTNYLMLIAMAIPLFLILFAMPSIYGHSGVTHKTVQFVIEYLQSRNFTRVEDIELLKKSLKPFEDRCRSRVGILKWIVGLLWAGFTYTYSKGTEHLPGSLTEVTHFLFTTVFLLFGTLAAYLCVWGYDAAIDRLFRAIEFGCNDLTHILETASTES